MQPGCYSCSLELSFQQNQEICVTVLNSAEAGGGRIVNLAGRRLNVESDLALTLGTPVKVEWNQTLLLGEIHEIRPGQLGIHIEHVLQDVDQLLRQRQAWTGQTPEES